jgi:hypothetical protein
MKLRTLGLVLAVPLLGACKDVNNPDLNNPIIPETGVFENPSRTTVQQLAIGIIIGSRTDQAAHIRDLSIIGRDLYNLDNADPRWVTELLGNSDFDPGGFGGGHWLPRYRNVRTANILLNSLATASTEVFTSEEISAAEGFAKTFKAFDLYHVWETREALGIPVEVGTTVDDLQPILCSDAALGAIAGLLDEAVADLDAGGDDFPFTLPPGFASFNTPETFRELNRALRGKVAVYQRQFTTALTALGQSFLNTSAPLEEGAYFDYGIGAGDTPNPIFQSLNTFRAHPSWAANAQAGDDRLAKIGTGTNRVASSDPIVQSNRTILNYPTATSQIPLITNKELILLRAQARIGANDLVGAASDINFIRLNDGGLAPVALVTADAAITELLRQKRYSLFLESGSRWVDHRFYGRLGSIAVESASYEVHQTYPIPQDEVLARGGTASCQ